MKKRNFAFVLALCWLVGMVAVCSFPQKIKFRGEDSSERSYVKELSGPELHGRPLFENLKVPPFEIDWRLYFKSCDEWIDREFLPGNRYFAPSYFQKSKAFFDIRLIFIRYFYSW